MKMNTTILAGLLPIVLTACATGPTAEQQAQYAGEAREAAGTLIKTLGGTLKEQLAAVGPDGAISVCREKAPLIAKTIGTEKNFQVRRVTTQQRNPKSAPDAWESKVLADFEQRLGQGAKPETLEYYQVVKAEDGTQTFRYMKGLVIQPLCQTCHGTPDTIPDSVKAKLQEFYPDDKAVGYTPGMLRGAITLKRAL